MPNPTYFGPKGPTGKTSLTLQKYQRKDV